MFSKSLKICLVFLWLNIIQQVHPYKIPEVKIEAYYPRGLRVLLPHETGTQLFAFHGNVNYAMRDYEIGQHYKDVLRPFNNSWIFEDRMVRLRKGDRLHYWLYVLHDGVGYRKDKQVSVIDDLIMENISKLPNVETQGTTMEQVETGMKTISKVTFPTAAPKHASIPSTTTGNSQNELLTCNQLIVNLTRKLVDTSDTLSKVEKENQILKAMISSRPNYKKLNLKGKLSPTEEPSNIVALVLSEKLGLRPRIASAMRNADNSITFELEDLQQTLDVIAYAKDKLANSTAVSITY